MPVREKTNWGKSMRMDQRLGDSRGLLAESLSLQESGVLVSGMTVTDLSTGFVVAGDAQTQHPEYLLYSTTSDSEGVPDVEFQRSGLSLGRLSELFELVSEVLEQRKDYPDVVAVNPPEPRVYFPWGIGLRTVDVLVTGSFAVEVVRYLRIMGIRARLVDNETVLRVASELAVAEQQLEHLGLARTSEAVLPAEPAEESDAEVDARTLEERDVRGERGERDEWDEEDKGSRRLAIALAALALFIVGGVIATFTVFDSQPTEGTTQEPDLAAAPDEAVQSGEVQNSDVRNSDVQSPDAQSPDVQGGEVTTREPFPEPRKNGATVAEHSARRADIPISVNVDGWHLGGATRSREEYVGDDDGMRVLVAAKQTPLKTQNELDAALLNALNDVGRVEANGVTVVSTQPVSYEETYANSTTLWHVRLVDGHQISVGCQYRQWNKQREKVCQEFVNTARPEKVEGGPPEV